MQVPLTGLDADKGTIRWRDPDNERGIRDARHRRPLQAAMEAGLGDALVCARGRLRDGGQGPDRFGQALVADRARARRRAARGLQLRVVPRREGPEDLEVEGQRPDHRRMADLRQPGEPVAVHVPEADGGQAALFRRDPAHRRRLSRLSRRLSAPGMEGAARQSRSGTSIPARRRRPRRSRTATEAQTTVSFAMLLNLAAVANSDNPAVLWGFLRRYAPRRRRETHPRLDKLVHYAVAYFRDFVAPKKRYRAADEVERGALEAVVGQARRAAAGHERRGNPARALRHRAADPALSGPRGPRARRRSGRASRTSSST